MMSSSTTLLKSISLSSQPRILASAASGRKSREVVIELDAAVDLALQDQRIKDLLRREVDGAIAKGVFGSPYIIVDGEPFWGFDRLDDVALWLEMGGW